MSMRRQRQMDAARRGLKQGEKVIAVGEFSALPRICLLCFTAAFSFVLGRVFDKHNAVRLVTNRLYMCMVADAARALANVQGSYVTVTNRRVFGAAGQKQFDLPHRQIKGVYMRSGLFLDSGSAQTSVWLRNLKNRKELYSVLSQYHTG